MRRRNSREKSSGEFNLAVSTWNYLCAYSYDAKLAAAIREIVEDNFGVELWIGWVAEPALFDESRWPDLRDMLGDTRLSVHTGLGSFDEALLRKEVDMAASLGAETLVAHDGTLGLKLQEESEKLECCRNAVNYAISKGVRVVLENGTRSVLENALAHVADLEICLDIGHANIAEGGIEAFLDRLGTVIGHVHLADNYGQTDDHLVPGDGYISMEDWRGLFRTLRNAKFAGDLVLELNTPDPKRDAKRSREFIKYVLRSIEDDVR